MSICNCVNCSCVTSLYKYKCETSGYNIYDDEEFIRKLYDSNINEDNNELNTESNIEYCSMCNSYTEFPDNYDNINKVFTNYNNNIYGYTNYLKRNIIHNFNNIQCDNCSNIMNKGKFTIEIVEETQENLNNLSIPNDFVKDIMVYDINNNFIYSIEPPEYDDYKELITFNTDISKNLLYCPNCSFIILNNLKKI